MVARNTCRSACLLLGIALAACGGATGTHGPATAPTAKGRHGHGHHHAPQHLHRFEDPERWAERWDAPERDEWQKPDAVIAALGLAADAHVADVGAGTGYFSVRFARALPEGRVYAVDVEPGMVEHVRKRAEAEGLGHLQAVLAAPDDPKIPAPVDVLFLCNTYHHITDREAWFRRARASLKPGGRVVVVDYRPDFDGPGPPPAMRLSADAVVAEMQAAGYRLAHRDAELLPRQYLLVFEPADAAH